MTGSLNRIIAKRQAQPKRRVLKTRDFLEFYQDQFNFSIRQRLEKWDRFLIKP